MTNRNAIANILSKANHAGALVRVVVADIDGSTPREAGAVMLVMSPKSPLTHPLSAGALSREGRGRAPHFAASLPSPARGEGSFAALSFPCPLPSRERAECDGIPGEGAYGTIGGGQLEFEAIAHARSMLEAAKNEPSTWMRDFRTYPLGPSLGQCCGGTARVLFEHFGVEEFATLAGGDTASASGLLIRPIASGEPLRHFSNRLETHDLPLNVARAATDMLSGAKPRRALLIPARKGAPAYFIEPAGGDAKPLYIYGAGHVGRAIVKAVEDLDFAVNWIDTHTDRFPDPTPEGVTPILARDPADVARSTPAGAFHLVLTYSHPLDLTICHALLGKPDFGFLGLIGSKSKRARFRKRLSEGGISDAALARMTCPIGIGALRGKEPATIAISVAAQLIERLEAERHNTSLRKEGEHGTVGRLSA